MSNCGVLNWRRVQTKSWTSYFVSLRIQSNSRTQVFHLRKRKQNRYITCLTYINLGRTRLCCWKVNNATFQTGFCFGVGKHEGFVTTAKFCRYTIIPRRFLKSFCCSSRSNRSCAAQIQNYVCRMVSKIQRGYRHPSSVSSRAIPFCSWSPRNIRPLTGRPVIRLPGMAISFFFRCF